jgi:hypothetical protein
MLASLLASSAAAKSGFSHASTKFTKSELCVRRPKSLPDPAKSSQFKAMLIHLRIFQVETVEPFSSV